MPDDRDADRPQQQQQLPRHHRMPLVRGKHCIEKYGRNDVSTGALRLWCPVFRDARSRIHDKLCAPRMGWP